MNKGPKNDKGVRKKNAQKVARDGLHGILTIAPFSSSSVPKDESTSASTLNLVTQSVTQEPKSGFDGGDKSAAQAPVIAPTRNPAWVPTTNSSTSVGDDDSTSSTATSTTEKATSEQPPSFSFNDSPTISPALPVVSGYTSTPVVAPISSVPMAGNVSSKAAIMELPTSTPKSSHTPFPPPAISRVPTTSPTTSPSSYPTSDPTEKSVTMPSQSPYRNKGDGEPVTPGKQYDDANNGSPTNSHRTPSPKYIPTLAPVMDPTKAIGIDGSPIASPSVANPIETKSPEVEPSTTITPENDERTMAPSSTFESNRNNVSGEGNTKAPTEAATEAPTLLDVIPSSSPEIQGFTKEIQTSSIIIQFRGSFDVDAVRDDIVAIVESELAPYLVLAIGSILQDFNLSMSFKSDGASLAVDGHRRQESTTDSVLSEVSVLLHLFGVDMNELTSFDETSATKILSDFFGGTSAMHLLQALLSAGINVESVEMNSFSTAQAEISNQNESGKRRENTTRTALLACMFSGSIVFAVLATAIIHSRRRHRKKFSLEQQLAETTKDVRSNTRGPKTQVLSDGSVSSCGDSMSTYSMNDFQDGPKKDCKGSPHLDSALLTMMDGPDLLVVTTTNMRCFTPSETESVFTTDEMPSALPTEGDTTEVHRKKRWRPWNRKSSKTDNERYEHHKKGPERLWFERVEIEGEMKNVYLSPIDL
jgi:hypothetical protein